MNINQDPSKMGANFPKSSLGIKIPIIIIVSVAIVATALALILGLSLNKKKKSNPKIPLNDTIDSNDSNEPNVPNGPNVPDQGYEPDDDDDVGEYESLDYDKFEYKLSEPITPLTWNESYEQAKDFVSKLNLTEKVNLLFGTENMKMETLLFKEEELPYLCVGQIDSFKNDKVDFKGMCLQDGPAGVRFAKGNGISWQGSMNNAMTFDKKLIYEVGRAQGEENKEKGINVPLGPCANMMRNPKGGRVWEAYGDDPYYVGVCANEITKGIQDAGAMACIKHFVGNDQETYRKSSSSNMDMATLMDIYVEPFYRSIKDGEVGSIMAGYNAINNSYCYENKFILTDVLRGILGFKGFVMSDWWAIVSDDPITINSGVDMNMPGGYGYGPFEEERKYDYYGRNHSYWSKLEQYIKEGKVKEERIDEAATRIIAPMYKYNQMENYPEVNTFHPTNTKENKQLQRKVATESQVLLKNEDDILPLKTNKIKKIAVIGNDAMERDCLPDWLPQCQNETNSVINGHVPLGYGSGVTNFEYVVTPLEGIKNLAKEYDIEVVSSGKLNYIDEKINSTHNRHVDAQEDIDQGVKVANESDVAIVFAKASSGEEFVTLKQAIGDRKDLNLWYGANELIEKVAEVNDQVIVVINAPATVNLPWLDKVQAVIFSGFPGAESGNAVADIIFGKVNPSGHLPFVWGKEEDYPASIPLENLTVVNKTSGATYKDVYRYDGVDSHGSPDNEPGHEKEQFNYTEGLYIGQRWFNKNNKKAIYPFGHGLSYTTFEYSDLSCNMNKTGLTAKFKVKNTGKVKGKAVPMMFLTFPDSIGDYPKYIFKGFEKVELEPGETKTVEILADDHALSYFNVGKNDYVRVDDGTIKVSISDNADPSQAKLSTEIDSKY